MNQRVGKDHGVETHTARNTSTARFRTFKVYQVCGYQIYGFQIEPKPVSEQSQTSCDQLCKGSSSGKGKVRWVQLF